MDIGKMIRLKQYRIETLANAFRENFEKKTGKSIGTGNNFNYEEIIFITSLLYIVRDGSECSNTFGEGY